jgi:hypothetical protein
VWDRLHSFLVGIAGTGIVWTLGLASLFVLLWINAWGLPGAFHNDALRRVGLLDLTINYSPDIAYAKLTAYGEQGRYAYRLFLDYVDSVFPALYGAFFLLGTTYAFARVFPGRPIWQKLSYLTLGTTVFDYAENFCFLAMLRDYPQRLDGVARVANIFTLTKWAFAVFSMVLVIIGAGGLLFRRRQTSD